MQGTSEEPWEEQRSGPKSRHYSLFFCNWKMEAIRERGSVCEIISCPFFFLPYLRTSTCFQKRRKNLCKGSLFILQVKTQTRKWQQVGQSRKSWRGYAIYVVTFIKPLICQQVECLPHFPQVWTGKLFFKLWNYRKQYCIKEKALCVHNDTCLKVKFCTSSQNRRKDFFDC